MKNLSTGKSGHRSINLFCFSAVICLLFFTATLSAQPTRTIMIVTEPDAAVWLDEVRFGRTDADGKLILKTVSAGKHSVRVRADGYKEITQNILAGQKGEVKIILSKTTDQAEIVFQEAEKLTASDRAKAAEAYRQAIKLRPRFPEAYVALARVLSDMGELEDATKAVLQARKMRPAYAEASAVEGRIHKDNGEEEKAVAAFKRAISEGRGFQPEAYTGLGLIYKEKGEGFSSSGDFESEAANYAEASKYLRTALTQLQGAPDTVIIYQLEGLIYERMGKYEEAISIYEEFLRLFPDTVEASAVQSFITQIKKKQAEQQ